MLKEILLKLSNGDNNFDCDYNGQKRKCQILQLDIRGLDNDYGRALVKFDTPVKKIERREVQNQWGLDRDDSPMMEDVNVESNEEWININNNFKEKIPA